MSENYAGASTLRRAAKHTEKAGKTRTTAWLDACAWIYELKGPDAPWPDAPAYKGAVVHVDAPGPDLKALTADQLTELGIAIDAERFERENG
jgi:hypothetical protein